MASILDRYGIKEVADITFYKINKDDGHPEYPVLYLDTAKTSTIEVTAETSDATGGKGNAKLISWDFGKEITVTLEDALFSAKSMAIMFGDGPDAAKSFSSLSVATSAYGTADLIMKTETFTASESGTTSDIKSKGWKENFTSPDNKEHKKINPKFFTETGVATTAFAKGSTYFCTYDLKASGTVIEVSANSFPGTYYVTGDTFARSETSGEDEFFQFVIPKAKVTSENTITLEAEGDPSVFSMNLTVLRPKDGVMMKLIKYDLDDGSDAATGSTQLLVHNHVADGTNTEPASNSAAG